MGFLFADINECYNTPSPCADVCTNTIGSYLCSCSSSFEMVTEDGNCTGNNDIISSMHQYVVIINCVLQTSMNVLPCQDLVSIYVATQFLVTIALVLRDINC